MTEQIQSLSLLFKSLLSATLCLQTPASAFQVTDKPLSILPFTAQPALLQASPQGVRKATVVEHLMPADVSSIKQESSILKACCIHFINYGQHSKQEMEALVRKLGGTVSR